MNKVRRKMVGIVFIAVFCVFLMMTGLIISAVHVYGTSQADQMTELMSRNKGRMPRFSRHNMAKDSSSKTSETENIGSEDSTTTVSETPVITETEELAKSEDGEGTESLGTENIPERGTELLVISAEEKGNYPWGYNEEMAFKTRYFIVYLEGENVKSVDTSHIAAVDTAEAESMMAWVAKMGRSIGYLEEFRYRRVEDENGDYVIFLDRSDNFSLLRLVALMMGLISMFFTVLITVIFGILSKKVVEPFEENAKRQKQFITDASHELKTPLAIISANAEVLEYKNGKNDWTKNIVDQTKAMGKLINQLLALSKMEELGDDLVYEEVELSGLVREKVESFREMALRRNADLTLQLPDQMKIMSGKEQMTQLVSILTENATKYVSEGGEIRVTLKKSGRNAILELYNTAEIDPEQDYNRLFDRFFRTDRSRSSQTGGHGIGLSVAKKIVTGYGGRISATPVSQGISFKAEIPMNLKAAKRKSAASGK